jgi:hypothetical protein
MHGFSRIQQLLTPQMILLWPWKAKMVNRIINHSLWPECSLHLTPCGFYLQRNIRKGILEVP